MVIEIDIYIENVDIWEQKFTAINKEYNLECISLDSSRLLNHMKSLCLIAIAERSDTIPNIIEFKINYMENVK